MASRTPVFNLNAVVVATGVKPDVLRAWERRYGLPMPQRTPGGHRLYSERDMEVIHWLRARQAEGLTISRAVNLWKETVEDGADPLTRYAQNGSTQIGPPITANGDRMEALRHEWLSAALAFDGSRADNILNQAFAIYPVETVLTELLQKAIAEIGFQWYLGQVTEQQEHFASGMAGRRLAALIAAASHPTRPYTICVGCPPDEWHTFPILLLGLLLQRRGFSVLYLGADVPVERLAETAGVARPDLVILAAQRLTTAATLRAAALALQAAGIPLAFGGLIFSRVPGLRDRIPAYFLGEDLEASVGAIEQLLVNPAPYPTRIASDEPHAALAREMREKQAPIELAVVKKLQGAGLDTPSIRRANNFLGSGLAAALELGNPAFMEPDLEWMKGFLAGRRIPAAALEAYLAAYSRAAHRKLGEAGLPMTQWIGAYLKRSKAALR